MLPSSSTMGSSKRVNQPLRAIGENRIDVGLIKLAFLSESCGKARDLVTIKLDQLLRLPKAFSSKSFGFSSIFIAQVVHEYVRNLYHVGEARDAVGGCTKQLLG